MPLGAALRWTDEKEGTAMAVGSHVADVYNLRRWPYKDEIYRVRCSKWTQDNCLLVEEYLNSKQLSKLREV